MSHPKTNKRAIKVADDTARALDLRREGQSIRDIAETLGRSVGWVHGALSKYTQNHPSANLDELRLEADARLRLLLKQVMPIAQSRKAKIESRMWAVDRALKVQKQLSDLHGLNAPTKVTFDVSKMSDAELRAIVSGAGGEPAVGSSSGAPSSRREGDEASLEGGTGPR